jgi:hypothetical protein
MCPRILPRLVLQRTVRALRVSPPELPFTSARGLGWAHPCARLPALGSVCMRARRPVVGLCPISKEALGGLFVCVLLACWFVRLFVCSCSLMANICSDEQKRALLLELVRARPMGLCTGTWPTPPTSALGRLALATSVPGLGPPRPHLCQDRALTAHVCTGTEPRRALLCAGRHREDRAESAHVPRPPRASGV